MDAGTVNEVLLEDIQSNLALLQTVGLFFAVAIALIGAGLAARANALLSEARFLYWRVHEVEKTIKQQNAIASKPHPTESYKRKVAPKRNNSVI